MQTFLVRAIGWTEPTFDGIIGVENNDDTPIYVREIRVYPSSGCTSSSVNGTGVLPGKFRFSYISSFIGSVDTITPLPHNTGSTALPSQVTLVTRPDSVVTTGTLRSFVPNDGTMSGINGYGLSSRNGGIATPQGDSVASLLSQRFDASAQPIILAEGTGIALLKTEADLPAVRRYQIVFTVVATGASWYADFATGARGSPDGVAWALFNATGSGVTLQVNFIEHCDNGDGANSNVTYVQSFPFVRLVRGEGCRGGVSMTPLSPISSPPPGNIRFVRGPFNHIYMGAKSGLTFDIFSFGGAIIPLNSQMGTGVLRRYQNLGIGIDTADPRIFMYPPDWEFIYKTEPGLEGLQINPGESLSLVGGFQGVTVTSVFDVYDVTIVIVVPSRKSESIVSRRMIA